MSAAVVTTAHTGRRSEVRGRTWTKSMLTDTATTAIHQRRQTSVQHWPKKGSAASRYQAWKR